MAGTGRRSRRDEETGTEHASQSPTWAEKAQCFKLSEFVSADPDNLLDASADLKKVRTRRGGSTRT